MSRRLFLMMAVALPALAVPPVLAFVLWQQQPASNRYFYYYSETNGRLNIGVRPDGTSEIGEHYDRLTEARKLFEMAKTLERNGEIPQCHETGYSPIQRDGIRPVDPRGPAHPPPPILDQKL